MNMIYNSANIINVYVHLFNKRDLFYLYSILHVIYMNKSAGAHLYGRCCCLKSLFLVKLAHLISLNIW